MKKICSYICKVIGIYLLVLTVGCGTNSNNGKSGYAAKTEEATIKITETEEIVTEAEIIDRNVSLSENEVEIMESDSLSLDVIFDPVNTSDQSVNWESSDNNVVEVNSYGVITGINPGKATVTVSSASGNTDVCQVNVVEKYYTSDNLPEGYFVKDGDKFYPFSQELPKGFVDCAHLASNQEHYYVSADEYDENSFQTLSEEAVLIYKGNVDPSVRVRKVNNYGYTFNASFKDNFDGNSVRGISGTFAHPDTLYENVISINGEELSFQEYAEKYGWIQDNTCANVFFNNFNPGDSIDIGYYEGTYYKEAKLVVDIWLAIVHEYSLLESDDWSTKMSEVKTKNGYSELKFEELPERGLYVFEFSNGGGRTLVWIKE